MSTIQPIRALTAIRGLAAWWVVLYHFREAMPTWTPDWFVSLSAQGYLAVDLFFELSGLVIALNYADRFSNFDFDGFREFIVLRLARIYPLHLFMLVMFLANPLAIKVFSTRGIPGQEYDLAYWLMSLVLVQNWGFTTSLAWNGPAWSISTEWFAYLGFPLMAAFAARLIRGPVRAVAATVVLLTTLALAASAVGPNLGSNIPRFGLMRCLLEFATGICLFHLRRHCAAASPRYSDLAALFALASFATSAAFPMPDYWLMPLGFALLIYALADARGLAARWFSWRFLEAIGLVSYSTYMAHFFIKDWVKFLLVRHDPLPQGLPFAVYLLLTACASFFLYHWIEMPGRRFVRSIVQSAVVPRSASL